MGRSGNLTEYQPKAKGSSLIQRIANNLTLQALRCSMRHIKDCFIAPMATGMSLLLCILTLKSLKPNAKYILLSRVDQKSGLKAAVVSGLQPIVIENIFKVILIYSEFFYIDFSYIFLIYTSN